MTNLARTNPPQSSVRVNDARALASVRSQAAFVRSLLDEVERIAPSEGPCPVSTQLVEELARLGCRFLEVAGALAAAAAPVAAETTAERAAPVPRCA